MKRQSPEDSCPIDLKKTSNPTQMAKRILCKSPLTIQIEILDRTPIVALLDWVDDRMDWRLVLALNKRFEMVCRDNNVLPRLGVQTKWARDFKRFLASLKSKRLYDVYPKEQDFRVRGLCNDYSGLDLGVTGNGFPFYEIGWDKFGRRFPRGIEVRLTLKRPQNQRTHLPRRTQVLESHFGADSKERYNFVLGNPFDLELARQEGQGISTFEYTFNTENHDSALGFDENDILYAMPRGDKTIVYRKDLELPDPPTPIFAVNRACYGAQLAIGNGRVFAWTRQSADNVHGIEKVLYCFDLDTGRRTESNDSQLMRRPTLDVQQDAVVYLGKVVYRAAEDGFQKRIMHGAYRIKRINQHSYINLERFYDKVTAFIISFVNNQVLEHFLVDCNLICQFGRYTEKIFYLVEQHQRHVWFQEKPGDEPHLLFRDNHGAAFEEPRCNYRICELVIPTRTRSLDRQESKQRRERKPRYQNLIDDTNVGIHNRLI